MPYFDKGNLGIQKIDDELLESAIVNARKKYVQCEDWHIDNNTTVFLLVEKILAEEDKEK